MTQKGAYSMEQRYLLREWGMDLFILGNRKKALTLMDIAERMYKRELEHKHQKNWFEEEY